MLRKITCLLVILATVLAVFPVSVIAEPFTDYYGRSVLSEMPNSEALVYAYDKIVAAVETHTEDPIEVYDGVHSLSVEEIGMVRDVYIRDYAHHFWLAGRWSYAFDKNKNTVLSVTFEYLMTAEQTDAAKKEFDARVDAILAKITPEMNQFDIELLLHDSVAANTVYKEGANAHNAYGALVEGVAVCEGYAEAFQYLLHRAGIRSFLAIGTSDNVVTGVPEGHEWNYVNIGGKWYHADVTWDDQDTIFHAYFNLSDERISADHTATRTAYELPKCDSDEAFYYTVNPGLLNEYDVASVASLLKDGGMSASVYVNDQQGFVKWYVDNIGDIAAAAGAVGAFSYAYSCVGGEVMILIKTSQDEVKPGDVNGDGNISAKDIILTMKYMLNADKVTGTFIFEAADMDQNGKITAKDVIAIMKEMLKK